MLNRDGAVGPKGFITYAAIINLIKNSLIIAAAGLN